MADEFSYRKNKKFLKEALNQSINTIKTKGVKVLGFSCRVEYGFYESSGNPFSMERTYNGKSHVVIEYDIFKPIKRRKPCQV